MNFNRIEDIQQAGFSGFVAISALQTSECCEIPRLPGVYMVVRPNPVNPDFLGESTGGHFKGKNPAVAVALLKGKWVEDALVLYVGKAGGPGAIATLNSRIRLYMQFGQGKPVGHWGGRYIWQLRHSGNLLVCWKTSDAAPRTVENGLIQEFERAYGKLPFANLVH